MKISGKSLDKINSKILEELRVISKRVAIKDPTIWGENTQAAFRLNWVDLPKNSRELLPQLDALSAWARSRNLSKVILCGMGGSSLAPQVITATYKKKLTIIDSTNPDQIQACIPKKLSDVIIVVGSKSGTTIETISHLQLFEKLLKQEGLNPIDHIVIVTDPATALDKSSRGQGYKVVNADSNVGGRFSALSAFGLVPAALAGVDISIMLDDAEALLMKLTAEDSPAAVIAALLFDGTKQIVNFSDYQSTIPGLSDWVEQLIAESTGKNKQGRLPVVIEHPDDAIAGLSIGFANGDFDLVVEGTLGEQFILWEWTTALLCYLLKVDPFDQPNVIEAKERTEGILSSVKDGTFMQPTPSYEDDDTSTYSDDSCKNLLEFLKIDSQYIAIMAYLNKEDDEQIIRLRKLIANKVKKPVTFGWGPRFLHSTGQIHKGGQLNGSFIQITSAPMTTLEIPGQSFDFGDLILAQALGDGLALKERNLPVIRIHLKDRQKALKKLLKDIESF